MTALMMVAMMVAMMLPSVAPTLWRYHRRSRDANVARRPTDVALRPGICERVDHIGLALSR